MLDGPFLVNGTVFALSTAGRNYQLLHSFIDFTPVTGVSYDGFAPFAGLVLSGKWLYGTTFEGGQTWQDHDAYAHYSGTVFAVNTNGDGLVGNWPPPVYSTLYIFTGLPSASVGNDGAYPSSSASLAYVNASPHPLMYRTTAGGGDNGIGTLFVLTQVTPPTMMVRHKPRSGVQAAAVEVAYDDPTSTFSLQAAAAASGPGLAVEHAVIPYSEPVTNTKYFRVVAYVTNPPVVVTLPATDVSANDAVLNGTVVPSAPFATAWFRYGSNTQYLAGATAKQLVTAYLTNAIAISNALSTLNAGATYHCQLVASNSIGITYGNDQSFTTFAGATAPDVVTLAAVGVTSNTATFTGTVKPNGANTYAYYQYGTDMSYGSQTSDTPVSAVNTNAVGVTNGAAMLLPGTLYDFQLVAVNSAGTTYGGNQQFVTPGPPGAQTGQASQISSSGATLGGYVFPNTLDTTAWFEYGLDTNYSAGTIGTTVVGASNFTGLAANTNCHYQLVASNSLGISYGGDESFPTPLGALPVAVTGSASNVTTTSALLSGTVNPEGIATMATSTISPPRPARLVSARPRRWAAARARFPSAWW